MSGLIRVPVAVDFVHYLSATVGTATTPDPGVLPQPCIFVAKVQGPVVSGGSTNHDFASQYNADPQRSWIYYRNEGTGVLGWTATATGLAANGVARTVTSVMTTQATEWLALSIQQTGSTVLTAHRSTDGGNWTQTGTRTDSTVIPFDSNGVVRIGGFGGASERFEGRIYSVELRTGVDPASGTVQWRFDAEDYPGTGTVFTDPRGQVWTLTTASAIQSAPTTYAPLARFPIRIP